MNNTDIKKIFDQIREQLTLHYDKIKKAALPVVVSAALLFFWIFGADDGEKVTSETDEQNLMVQQEVTEEISEQEKAENIYVDISGCVKNPGVYQVQQGTRIFQVIEKAGGLADGADTESLNRAEVVTDGQKIVIYAKGEDNAYPGNDDEQESKININSADSQRLQDVPGVGPATAEKIIRYREENGFFSSVEDLLNVSGIGEKTLENMREYITV